MQQLQLPAICPATVEHCCCGSGMLSRMLVVDTSALQYCHQTSHTSCHAPPAQGPDDDPAPERHSAQHCMALSRVSACAHPIALAGHADPPCFKVGCAPAAAHNEMEAATRPDTFNLVCIMSLWLDARTSQAPTEAEPTCDPRVARTNNSVHTALSSCCSTCLPACLGMEPDRQLPVWNARLRLSAQKPGAAPLEVATLQAAMCTSAARCTTTNDLELPAGAVAASIPAGTSSACARG
jgi:hypothetical protein